MNYFFSVAIFMSMLRGATPLVFASMGGLLSEKSGVVQIALEGFMLTGALWGAIFGLKFSNPWMAFAIAGLASMLLAQLFCFFVLYLRSNQIVVGTAINIFAAGVSPFVTKILFDSTGSTPALPMESRFLWGPIVLAIVVAMALHLWIQQTKAGLFLQFGGEQPEALQASGHNVFSLRWMSVTVGAGLAGLGGACLSMFLASSYSPNMTAGRGFMSLAALIFGKWKPLPTLAACLFFAYVDAVQVQLQGVAGVPVQLIQILPYVITIVAVTGFFGGSKAPKFLGR